MKHSERVKRLRLLHPSLLRNPNLPIHHRWLSPRCINLNRLGMLNHLKRPGRPKSLSRLRSLKHLNGFSDLSRPNLHLKLFITTWLIHHRFKACNNLKVRNTLKWFIIIPWCTTLI